MCIILLLFINLFLFILFIQHKAAGMKIVILNVNEL